MKTQTLQSIWKIEGILLYDCSDLSHMYIKLLLERLFKDLFFKKCKCNIFSGNSVHKILNLKYKGFLLFVN